MEETKPEIQAAPLTSEYLKKYPILDRKNRGECFAVSAFNPHFQRSEESNTKLYVELEPLNTRSLVSIVWYTLHLFPVFLSKNLLSELSTLFLRPIQVLNLSIYLVFYYFFPV